MSFMIRKVKVSFFSLKFGFGCMSFDQICCASFVGWLNSVRMAGL